MKFVEVEAIDGIIFVVQPEKVDYIQIFQDDENGKRFKFYFNNSELNWILVKEHRAKELLRSLGL